MSSYCQTCQKTEIEPIKIPSVYTQHPPIQKCLNFNNNILQQTNKYSNHMGPEAQLQPENVLQIRKLQLSKKFQSCAIIELTSQHEEFIAEIKDKLSEKLNQFKLVSYQQRLVLYNNDTCKIFTDLINMQMGRQVKIYPISQYIVIKSKEKQGILQERLKLKQQARQKVVKYRLMLRNQKNKQYNLKFDPKNDQNKQYNLKFDSDDRAIHGYLRLTQLNLQPRFCNEDWSQLEEPPVFCDKHNCQQYVRCDDLQI